ncbi:hypothetical protein EC604_17385 [Paenibacillus amylolyticus]|uniref:Uncharacterized protein n=1 Tax=Paenibacillus amylolyticus TaxID=1451 RepID=A0A5M9WVE2_PAEAM|nr:hypothetical protein [Paenibacillus amylolyticus]KAA8785616.1 hypothetical protein EC604_17385 [Paenibacillus amylolyticus]
MRTEKNQEILDQRDVDNIIISIVYLLVIFGSIFFHGFFMAIVLYISTLFYFNRVRMFDKVSRSRFVILATYLQITLPLFVVLASITKFIEFVPNDASGNMKIYIVLAYYILTPIILNLISFTVFKKHENFSINQKPALEIGRMVIWGATLTTSVLVIADGIDDNFIKVSFLIVMAPLLIFNYAVKVTFENDSALKEYRKNNENNEDSSKQSEEL